MEDVFNNLIILTIKVIVMKLQILGPGCKNCSKLEENAKQAAEELGVDCEIIKITDQLEMMRYRVMMTPGFAIDGELKKSGKVLSVDEIKGLLSEL